MADNSNGTIQRAGSGDRAEQAAPQVIRAAQRASDAQAEAVQGAEKATRQVLRAGAEMLSEAGDKARTAAGIGDTPEAKQALQEWAGLAGRVFSRNCRAVMDVMQCRSVGQLMGKQTELLLSNYNDWVRTSMTVMNVAAR